MSGSIQSSNYVPGVSGWKLNTLIGDFEINSSSIAVGSLPSDPQPITITAGGWSDYDLPANAIERYAFIGAELAKIPAECRASAEFTTEDISFDRDGSDYRTTLTYIRQETQEEAKARHEKARLTGARIVRAGGCTTGIVDGVVRWRFGDLDAPLPEPEQPQPFKVDGEKVYLEKAFVDDASITKAKIVDECAVRIEAGPGGRKLAAGIGLGIESQYVVKADRFAINGRNASDLLRDIASMIDETTPGQGLKEQVDLQGSSLADQVKTVLRKELMPGGLLHRSR